MNSKSYAMIATDFTTTLLVHKSPGEVFKAITNIRGWWSEDIEGGTSKPGEVFDYHYEDVHFTRMKLIEVIPDIKLVWLVLDNHFNFIKDNSEWKGTKIIFEISAQGNQTEIRFTHEGLVPDYECYDICHDAWTNYIQHSLRDLITTGKGEPNPKGGRNVYQESISRELKSQDYHIRLIVEGTPHEVFKKINSVTKWWTEDLTGSSENMNDEFTVRFGDIHVSTQKLIEVVPDKKVVWLVTASRLNFLKEMDEWNNTKVKFELTELDNKTQIDFTHVGLIPQAECYIMCVEGWDYYIKGSLYKLLTEGKGMPG